MFEKLKITLEGYRSTYVAGDILILILENQHHNSWHLLQGIVNYQSKLQKCVALSASEAKLLIVVFVIWMVWLVYN